MRVLVCGGRDYTAEWNVFAALEACWWDSFGNMTVIEGGARGADEAASIWAEAWRDKGVIHEQYRANWREHGKSAGPRRNQRMLDEGQPDVVLAFPGGAGTADMVRRSVAAGLVVKFPHDYAAELLERYPQPTTLARQRLDGMEDYRP